MSKIIALIAKLTGAKKTNRGLKSIDASLKKLGKSAIAAGAAFFGGRAIISGLQKSIELSAKMEGLQRGFDNLTKSAGFSTQAFNKLQKATDGTMSSFDLMKQANNAMLLGIFESDDQMAKMFDTAQRLAQALGKDAAFGIESLVTGMGRQSKLMLDNLGIMVKAEDAYKRYAAELHKSVSELTDMERKQAFVNEAMKEANKLVKSLGAEQLTTADAINQMKTAVSDTSIIIGDLLSPAVISIATGFKGAAEAVSEYITQLKLSNTELEGIVDTEERIAVIEAKLIEARKMSITSERDGLVIKSKVQEKTELIAGLEEQLAIAKMGNFAVFSPEEQAHLDRLQATIDKEKAHSEEWNKLAEIQAEEPEILGDIKASEAELAFQRKESAAAQEVIQNKLKEMKLEEMALVAKGASTMQSGIESVIRGYVMEAVAGHIAKVLGGVPFPLNLILAAAAGGVVNELMSSAFSQVKAPVSFAQGGEFVTSGPQMIVVGDNPSGKERVQITPSEQSQSFNQGGVTINISAPLVDETVVDSIIPAIEKAQRLNLA